METALSPPQKIHEDRKRTKSSHASASVKPIIVISLVDANSRSSGFSLAMRGGTGVR
jgi:hypothetical protein